MSEAEDPRLAQIRALCDAWSGDVDLADRIRAVLDAPPVDATPAQGIDREALIADAMRMLYEHSPHPDHRHDREEAEEFVDRMLLHGSYLTAAPDRDIIAAAIQTDFDVRNPAALRVADRILALVRPVEGVTLTHREAQTALGWYADAWDDDVQPAQYDRDLAQKLGDAQ